MKRTTICIILLIINIITTIQIINHITNSYLTTNYYAMTCEVVELDHENDLVILIDSNGFKWVLEHTEDWQVGDCVSLLMDNNGTSEIFDDSIISMTYNAWELS